MMRFSFAILMVFLFIIALTDKVSSLNINELESNPEGEDSGFEWIELYSQEEVNLEGYLLDHEGRGAQINLSGTFSGFFVLNIPTQWLRNTNETVYLKDGDQIVQTVGPFSDNKVEKTYSLCDDEWVFVSETKNSENSCGNNQNNPSNTNNNNNKNEEEDKKEKIIKNVTPIKEVYSQKNEVIENSRISLANDENKYEITRTYKTRVGVIYFFIGFCVLLVVLIAIRKL